MKRRWSKSLIRIMPMPWGGGQIGFLFFVAISAAIFILSVVSPQSLTGVRTNVSDAMAPVLNIISKPVQETAGLVRNMTGLSELQAENKRLLQENDKLKEWYQAALVLQSENKALRDLLNVKLEPQNRYITARILSDSGRAFVKSLLVSSGRKEGVEKGQAVISGDGLVGRIIESGDKTSRVLMVTDINSRVPVLIENSSQHAILAGSNDQWPYLVHLPPGSEVEKGARIITSGHGGLFPKGLPVGRVVFDNQDKPRVELFADLSRMVYVRVVDWSGDPNLHPGQNN